MAARCASVIPSAFVGFRENYPLTAQRLKQPHQPHMVATIFAIHFQLVLRVPLPRLRREP